MIRHVNHTNNPIPMPNQIATEASSRTARHAPGDGWHLVPVVDWQHSLDAGWTYVFHDSTTAVLIHARQVATAFGWDVPSLWAEAQEELFDDDDDLTQIICARPATAADIRAVLDDLVEVNAHALALVLRRQWYRHLASTPGQHRVVITTALTNGLACWNAIQALSIELGTTDAETLHAVVMQVCQRPGSTFWDITHQPELLTDLVLQHLARRVR